MKLVTFEVTTPVGRFERLGAVLDDLEHIVDLNATYAWLLDREGEVQPKKLADVVVPSTMRGFIEAGEKALNGGKKVFSIAQHEWNRAESVRFKGGNGEQLLFHRSTVRLKAPLPNPNSLRDFLAFEAHVKKGYERRGQQMPEQWYKLPVYYKGNHRSMVGPDEPVVWPRYTEKLDYELELACIIGKKGRDVTEENAAGYIFGYTVMNDFSARDIQMEEMICRLGPAKGKDFATAIGPWIVTADEVPDPRNLRMIARINGDIWSDGNSGTSHWTWEQMIAHVSNEEDLYPGDILGSGTVGGGCGYELDRWIKPGDTIELEIEGLGRLRNPVITHEQAQKSLKQPEVNDYVSAS